MTPSTAAISVFEYCACFFAPFVGLVVGILRIKLGFFKNGAIGFGIVIAALGLGALVGKLLFPNYPNEIVYDHIAILFTGLTPVGAVAVVWWAARNSGKSKVTAGFGITLVVFFFVFGSKFNYRLNTWGYREQLPPDATEVFDVGISDDFLGDFAYQLKANITYPQFLEYTARYELRNVGLKSPNRYAFGSWWLPLREPERGFSLETYEVFEKKTESYIMQAIYHDGTMWICASQS